MNVEQAARTLGQAQGAQQLDQIAGSLIRRLGAFVIEEPLKSTGMTMSSDAAGRCLVVQAHGKTLRSSFEHVWRTQGESARLLVGRLQFRVMNDEQKPGKVIHEIFFDTLGNACLDGTGRFAENVNPGRDDAGDTFQKIGLMLIARIHQTIDTVTWPTDAAGKPVAAPLVS